MFIKKENGNTNGEKQMARWNYMVLQKNVYSLNLSDTYKNMFEHAL